MENYLATLNLSKLDQFSPNLDRNPFPPFLNPQEPRMASSVTINFRPITTPHLDLDHVPLADKDFQIKDTIVEESPLKL